ncbi:hypothetical protein [Sphingomonas xanthus]|uniref:ABC transporter n=1 Tax=Sphingomonas xanthus TaxID=2594473 RepID=A0A516IQJ7_9SPHN|nr:hypothetical protein [Sphingomonas xanthus]QDP19166.1 hypothetical protein FMM02_03820 [Sphingomonas xanthus]
MNPRWIGVLLALAAALSVAILALRQPPLVKARAEGPELALLTSLPLMFGDSFGLEAGGSAVLDRLDRRYTVTPIAVTDRASLLGKALLLMAHPRAQPAEALVDLDRWVREGGRLLLLADPLLEWPSSRPLGDLLRPPPGFADTGLLNHWGLALQVAPERGPVRIPVGRSGLIAVSPGRLSTNSSSCALSAAGLIARCRIGSGRVTIIADADWINVDSERPLAGPTDANLDIFMTELAMLERQ